MISARTSSRVAIRDVAAITHASLVVAALLGGGTIYLAFRATSLRMFAWADALGAADSIARLRIFAAPYRASFSDVAIYSLPNALWAYALAVALRRVWITPRAVSGLRSIATSANVATAAVAAFVAGVEVLQSAAWLPGTGDLADALTAVVACGCAWWTVRN